MTTFGTPQDSLFGHKDGDEGQGRPVSIDDRFREFDRAHPAVFRLFAEYAESLLNAGITRYSADAILHRIRWHHHVERGDRAFALNDHFASRYARLLISTDPRFEQFFELRALRSERSAS